MTGSNLFRLQNCGNRTWFEAMYCFRIRMRNVMIGAMRKPVKRRTMRQFELERKTLKKSDDDDILQRPLFQLFPKLRDGIAERGIGQFGGDVAG